MAGTQRATRAGLSRLASQALVLILLLVTLPAALPAPPSAGAAPWTEGTFTTSATTSATSPAPGDTITVTATIVSSAATAVQVEIGVYDPTGVRRSQTVFGNEAFAAGVERTFPVSWTVPAGATSGGYTVKIGVFQLSNGPSLHQNEAAAFFTVGMGALPDTPVRIMPLGDSLTDGYTVEGGYRIDLWSDLNAAGHSFDFVGSRYNGRPALVDKNHEGHNGWRIEQLANALDPWLVAYRPQIVLLLIGTNDMAQNYDAPGAPARLGALIDQIRASLPDAYIVVSSIPRTSTSVVNQRILAYNAAIPGLVSARDSRVSFVDGYAAIQASHLDPDGIHLNQNGYARLADVWYPVVHALLNTFPPPVTCTPRPRVAVSTVRDGAGHLSTTIVASGANNTLREIRIGDARNARIDVGSQTGTGGFTVPLPSNPTSIVLTVSRLAAGAGVHVPLVVVDRCGEWPTFVGGGPNAF